MINKNWGKLLSQKVVVLCKNFEEKKNAIKRFNQDINENDLNCYTGISEEICIRFFNIYGYGFRKEDLKANEGKLSKYKWGYSDSSYYLEEGYEIITYDEFLNILSTGEKSLVCNDENTIEKLEKTIKKQSEYIEMLEKTNELHLSTIKKLIEDEV